MEQKYFAALPPDELAREVMHKIEVYYRSLEENGFLRKFRKSYDQYFGYSLNWFFNSSSDVGYGGEQGELAAIKVNHFRSLLQHLLVMTTSNRPTLDAKATNSDAKSFSQTTLANGILEYYLRDKRLERHLKQACEHSLLWGEGFVHIKWNPNLGQEYGIDPDSGQTMYEGDLEYSVPLGPLECGTDVTAQNADVQWRFVLERMNKFDLAVQFPEKAEQIIQINDPFRTNRSYTTYLPGYRDDSPMINVYRFYHKKTPALPNGREFWVISPDLWLIDSALPHNDLPGGLPLFRISPSDFFGTPHGYTSCWDTLGLSEVIDALHSAVTTNQTTFAVQNIISPKGSDIDFQQLAGGLNYLEYDPKLGKPEALQLTKTPPEVFNYIDALKQEQQLIVGVNDVLRGTPDANIKSGSFAALIASQALQFNSGLQASYAALLEDVGTATIRFLQTFANTQRVASIAGKSKAYTIKLWSKEDLSEINRVVVDVANPLSRTLAGRMEMAEKLLQVPGLIKRPEQIIQVYETGRLEPLIENEQAELTTIRLENESMMIGQKPTAIVTDKHSLHIAEHKAVIGTPEARNNPALLQATLSHIQEHYDLISNTPASTLMVTDPDVLQVKQQQQMEAQMGIMPGFIGQAPMQMQQGMPSAPGPAPISNGLQAPEAPERPGAPSAPELLQAENPINEAATQIQPAQMPKNPATGERFNPNPGQM